jgi:hypothetical protein
VERGFWNTHKAARLDREPNVGVPSISQSTEAPSEPKRPAAQTAKRRRASSSNSPVSRVAVMMLSNSSSTAAASAFDAARPRHAVSLPGFENAGRLAYLRRASGRNAKQAVSVGFSHILGNVLGIYRPISRLQVRRLRG